MNWTRLGAVVTPETLMDFIRPLLMPVLVVLIVVTIWCMGWMKSLEAQIEQASHPTERALYIADAFDDPE
jgi:hypothetical protein